MKNPPGGRRKYEVSDGDRMFSNSSVTHKKVRTVLAVCLQRTRLVFAHFQYKALELAGEGEDSTGTMDDHHQSLLSTPGLITVAVPPAKTQEMTAAQQKKHRDREYQRKKRANAARRSAALSDEESVTSASGRRPTKRTRVADDDRRVNTFPDALRTYPKQAWSWLSAFLTQL